MSKVIEALRYMADHSDDWYIVIYSGVWPVVVSNPSSKPDDGIGFSHDELQQFLKHYEELVSRDQPT